MSDTIKIGDQAFLVDKQEEFGAIRAVSKEAVVVYVENAGDFTIPVGAVVKVAFGKVSFDVKKLDKELRRAIGHAHDAENV